MELTNMFCPHTSSNGLTELSEVSSLKCILDSFHYSVSMTFILFRRLILAPVASGPETHWVVPALAGILFGHPMTTIFISFFE